MKNIIGIPTTRVSDLLIRQRILQQLQYDQRELFRLQSQLSTGRKFELPGEDPVAALRTMSLQRLLERKEQVQSNLVTNQSYLSATDVAMSRISGLVAEVRAVALGAIGTVVTDDQRRAAVQQIDQVTRQLMDAGNQNFRGRYLFAGSTTLVQPFRAGTGKAIEYLGNEEDLPSYSDIDMLFTTNMTGSQAFGAISEPVRGTVDLNPILTYDTRLADLRGGKGITPGGIAISDGTYTSIVDISNAETIGDVAALIRANPPETRSIDVEITARGLVIQLDSAPGDLSIREVGGGTTAYELGILREVGLGNSPIVGADLDPILRPTTRLDDILGTRARAVIRSGGPDNDFILEADTQGANLNGVTVTFVDDPLVTAGNEVVIYDPALQTIEIRIDEIYTRAHHVVDAINDAHALGDLPFTAWLDPLDDLAGGEGLIPETPPGETAGETAGGSGIVFDRDSGLQILQEEQVYTISLSTAETIEDVLNILNGAGAGLLAEINQQATGINVRSRLSGVDFAIGENGGTTATELGLRTFTTETRLEELNFGLGVIDYQGDSLGGAEFVITRADGVTLEIDIAGAETIGDVIDRINDHPDNLASGVPLLARLAAVGNGIELVDDSIGPATLTVTRNEASTVAIELGLVPEGQLSSTATQPGAAASVLVESAAPNSNLIFRALETGTHANGVQVIFQDLVPATESFTYDDINGILTFEIDAGTTDANRIIQLFNGDPLAPTVFSAELDPNDGNDGTGLVDVTDPVNAPTMSGGEPEILTGIDVHPLETEGMFTALLRLQEGFEANDLWTVQRAVDMLDAYTLQMNFARAELGARQQSLDVLQTRLDAEEVELRSALSLEHDADIIEVISNLSGRQLALEATLMATAKIFEMTLLHYL